MSETKYVTVFTPTYNRKESLQVLYDSLCKQTSKDFEWLIVDDGSVDQTEEYINSLKNIEMPIRYLKKENGGKHTAINLGVKEATGHVFAIVDSDDYLVPEAIETIIKWFDEIKDKKDFAGVAAQRAYENSKPIGSFYDGNVVDALATERSSLNINGDKFEIYYTSVLRKFPFPVFEGERFLTEAVVWNRIAHTGLKIRWHSTPLYICEYLENGLTDQKDRLVKSSPKGYALYIREIVQYKITLKSRLGHYSYYYGLRKDQCSLKQVSEELDCSIMTLMFSVLLRKFLYLVRR